LLTLAPDDTEFPDLTIKYDTRTQFFKALHDVFERNLLKSGYVRFGRWFTRPLDEFAVSPDCAMPSYINGLRFEFAVQVRDGFLNFLTFLFRERIMFVPPSKLNVSRQFYV
jgi:hypothetical protein